MNSKKLKLSGNMVTIDTSKEQQGTVTQEQLDMIQRQVEHWMHCIKELQEEQEMGTPRPWSKENAERMIAEYKGRIYATRCITGLLGITVDTTFMD